jgi:alcohol dehydrogenase
MVNEAKLIGDLKNNFHFALPTQIKFGCGASSNIAEVVLHYQGRNVLVVTDIGVRKAGLVDPIVTRLTKAKFIVTVFDEIEANPSNSTIDHAAELASRQKVDVIVAIGGGSSIDAAKGIAAVVGGGGGILDYIGMDHVPPSALPLIAIPTTAGTGSEVTNWAIITDPVRKVKKGVGSLFIAPRIALIDPEVTVSLPPGITAATGIDALTHAIEAYTARCANPVSDAMALYAIELIGKHLDASTIDGRNLEARSGMLLGSLLAGMAFGNSDTAAVHSLAEALGGMFDVAHGVANAIFLPYVK